MVAENTTKRDTWSDNEGPRSSMLSKTAEEYALSTPLLEIPRMHLNKGPETGKTCPSRLSRRISLVHLLMETFFSMILINIPGTEQIKKSSGVFRNEWNPCAIDPEEHLEQKSAGFRSSIPGRESVSSLVAIGRVCVAMSHLCPCSTRVSDSASRGPSCVPVALQARCGPWSIGVDITS